MYLSKSRPLFLWSCLPFTNTCLSQRPPFRRLPPITGDRPQAPVVPPNQVAKQVSLSKWWLAIVLHRWSQSTVGAFTVGRQTEALPRLSDIACRKVYTDRRLKRHLSPIDVAKSSIQGGEGSFLALQQWYVFAFSPVDTGVLGNYCSLQAKFTHRRAPV